MALPVWQGTAVSDDGDVQPGAQIDVIDEATGLVPAGGIYSDRAGTVALTNPFFADSEGFAQFYAAAGEYRITASGIAGTRIWRYEVLTGTAATLNAQTSATDKTPSALMAVGAFGIGSGAIPLADATDADAVLDAGFYYITNMVNAPSSGSFTLEVGYTALGSGRGWQVARRVDTAGVLTYERKMNGGLWSGWEAVIHTGIFNQSVFGGEAINDTIAIGFAQNSTNALFYLPLSFVSSPASVALTSTLKILDVAFATIATGISSVTLSTRSSNKLALVAITTTGLTAGQTLQLSTETATSKIVVS